MAVTYNSTNNMEMAGKDQFCTASSKNKSKTCQIKPVGSQLTC